MLAALALPVAAAMAAHGGFFPRGQLAFALVAAGSAAAVLALCGGGTALREPALLCLFGLAALTALSAAWTIAEPKDALRWGAVVAGYALLALAASVVAARVGAVRVAAVIAILAAAAGIVGVYGAGARVEPLAQRLGGQWSPGGPLEYSPALALAQVSALPVLLFAACSERSWRWPAAAGLAVAGSVLGLAGSRVELGLGLACAGLMIAYGNRRLGVRRGPLLAAAALAVTAGGLADAIAGSYVAPFVTGGDAPRLLGLAAVIAAAPALWLAQRRLLGRAGGSGRRRALAWTAVIAPMAVALALAAATNDSGPQTEPVSGFSHGRVGQWRAAVETAADRPLAGAGAGAFYQASIPHQEPPPVRFAHNLALESWAELGLAGALLMIALYGYSGRLAWARRASAAGWLLAPGVIAFLVANLFDWPWHVPASGALFAIALGGLAGSSPAPGAIRAGPEPMVPSSSR